MPRTTRVLHDDEEPLSKDELIERLQFQVEYLRAKIEENDRAYVRAIAEKEDEIAREKLKLNNAERDFAKETADERAFLVWANRKHGLRRAFENAKTRCRYCNRVFIRERRGHVYCGKRCQMRGCYAQQKRRALERKMRGKDG